VYSGKSSHCIEVDNVLEEKFTSPPPSPTSPPSNLGETAFSVDSKQPVMEKRPRDPHRKEIENRAADKRKLSVKRLQNVLAVRTRGLPENGLANQLHMAADQLE
jgi:hypothetical protein